jgi:hypothetical protein
MNSSWQNGGVDDVKRVVCVFMCGKRRARGRGRVGGGDGMGWDLIDYLTLMEYLY